MHRAALFHPAIVLFPLVCASLAFPQEPARKYWVFFNDKGHSVPASGALQPGSPAYCQALTSIQPRALRRRAKVLPHGELIDAADAPVYEPYIQEVRRIGGTLLKESRWVNAASFLLTPGQFTEAVMLPCARIVRPIVAVRKGTVPPFDGTTEESPLRKSASLDYGPSISQVQLINVPPLHSVGISGKEVLVGMLDTGFRWRVHEALSTRRVIAEHDFIQNDDTTANQEGDAGDQDSHGTATMSVLGGYKPGKLIGPAFDAQFILAKTEYVPVTDSSWEEDDWAAGIEWMEGLGVDVVSSSLGYNVFVDIPDYTWQNGDFDGRTTVSARAAVRAARLGVVVCNTMGNERNGNGVVGTLITPADADSILSVGAVSFAQTLASFSSTGPTNDGRTKPDVVAPGVGITDAHVPNLYGSFDQGTSFSTPLTAGSAALMLSARPELTPIQVRDALRNTATPILDNTRFPASPNNFTGWGLVNAFNATLSFGPIFSNEPALGILNSKSVVSIDVISKFGLRPESVQLHYTAGDGPVFSTVGMSLDSSEFFPTSGRYTATIPAQAYDTLIQFYIESSDGANNSYRSPAAIAGRLWQLHYGVSGVHLPMPESYALEQNFPNPFNSSTTIRFDLPRTEHVTVKVYNFLGEEVETLIDRVQDAGGNLSVSFSGSNLPSGVYFYRMTTPSFTSTNKMILIR